MTMMYLLPRLEVTGNRPVWSEHIRPVKLIGLAKTRFVRELEGLIRFSVMSTLCLLGDAFVDRICWRICLMWPLDVDVEG